MDTVRYVFAVLTVTWLPPAIAWWYVIHPFVGFWRRRGPALTMGVMGAFLMGTAGALFLVRGPLVGTDLGADWTLAGLGVGLMVVSSAIAVRRRRQLTFRILAGIPELEEGGRGTLLTEGPYAFVRHPRYAEVVIGMVGYALVANYVGVYLVVALSTVALHGVVLLEERELAERFGQAWQVYRARVPRYVPRLSGKASRPPR